jgi:hypothetical protein
MGIRRCSARSFNHSELEVQRMPTYPFYPNRDLSVYAKPETKNPQWKGNNASDSSARSRAKRRIPVLGNCPCGRKATDRHHKDGNPHNNHPSNISQKKGELSL